LLRDLGPRAFFSSLFAAELLDLDLDLDLDLVSLASPPPLLSFVDVFCCSSSSSRDDDEALLDALDDLLSLSLLSSSFPPFSTVPPANAFSLDTLLEFLLLLLLLDASLSALLLSLSLSASTGRASGLLDRDLLLVIPFFLLAVDVLRDRALASFVGGGDFHAAFVAAGLRLRCGDFADAFLARLFSTVRWECPLRERDADAPFLDCGRCSVRVTLLRCPGERDFDFDFDVDVDFGAGASFLSLADALFPPREELRDLFLRP